MVLYDDVMRDSYLLFNINIIIVYPLKIKIGNLLAEGTRALSKMFGGEEYAMITFLILSLKLLSSLKN
ncbi:hypothetical protein [Caloramator quimbayensis]|uniref:hypothetical protein n=1 Tax=Caloramator quimbayensis TaxID=1147123 RepID=UPI00099A0516|nr:hypothetical protein [Caloramator quimbayensis]